MELRLKVGAYGEKVVVTVHGWNYPLPPEAAVALARKLMSAAVKADSFSRNH